MSSVLPKPLQSVANWRPNKRMPSVKETFSPGAFVRGPIGERMREKAGLRQPPQAIDAPPPPTIEDAESSREAESARLRRRRGRAAAVVNDGSVPMTAAKTLLGG